MQVLEKPWTHSKEDVFRGLGVSSNNGLSSAEVSDRRRQFGPNRLKEAKTKSVWLILADQFASLLTLLLGVAALLSLIFGDWVEGFAILAVIVINASLGFFTELKAVRSMEALYRLSSVNAKVRREGEIREISASELVPGDMVIVEGGDIVTADLRLIDASRLQADESALTGESAPVSKSVEKLEGEIQLAERKNMLFKGTAVTRGSGEGIVTATGMRTELGHISSLVAEAKDERTPLEKQLDRLGNRLIWVTLGIAAVVTGTGIVSGKGVFLMIETGIALAVATIPEGLPIVATIALARGMLRMAHRNALINRLSAVETLGATGIICTDKTGTLTENRMTVVKIGLEIGETEVDGEAGRGALPFSIKGRQLEPSEQKILNEALETGVLCNNAFLKKEESKEERKNVGDPLEIAILVAGEKAGIRRGGIIEKFEEVREEAFDPETKMMATFHKDNGYFRVAVKGAPESVLEACTSLRTIEGERKMEEGDRRRWLEYNNRLAEKGLRILALATGKVKSGDSRPYEDLTFLGLMGLLDPPRKDVRQAIASCKEAGIRVVMVTGDQAVTARAIGSAVGLVQEEDAEVVQGKDLRDPEEMSDRERTLFLRAPLFARVNPEQKLDLIALHQRNGSIVAMTGDGVNDAPALKKADIGIAMGQRGTQVAREAADMVLKDDSFSTIVAAVEQGRIIFGNIRKFVLYLLSCNISEVMVVSLASLINAPLPILPLQILFLNLVTDVFPALALGVGEGDPSIMNHPPRDPREPILTRSHWLSIAGYGSLITLSVLGVFAFALLLLKAETKQAVTISFSTLAFAQLWHVFNMRDQGSGILRNDVGRNPFVWAALALCAGLLVSAIYLPVLSRVLKLVDPGAEGWALIIGGSMIPWLVGQFLKSL